MGLPRKPRHHLQEEVQGVKERCSSQGPEADTTPWSQHASSEDIGSNATTVMHVMLQLFSDSSGKNTTCSLRNRSPCRISCAAYPFISPSISENRVLIANKKILFICTEGCKRCIRYCTILETGCTTLALTNYFWHFLTFKHLAFS